MLGDVANGEMQLNEYGLIVDNEWVKTAKLRVNVMLDQYVVMPNHIPGVIINNGSWEGRIAIRPYK